jgi:hypothetical protein
MREERCPTCGQTVSSSNRPRRICVLCQQPITTRHKWRLNASMQCQHRCCEYPEHRSREAGEEASKLKETPLFDQLEETHEAA